MSRSVGGCGVFANVYSDLTNQVPATWFACDAGIRRLASLSDGPARGRRRFFTHSGFSVRRLRSTQYVGSASFAERRRLRAAVRSDRSASTSEVTMSSRWRS